MFELADLGRLTQAMRANDITTLDIKSEDEHFRLVLRPRAEPVLQSDLAQVRHASAKSPGIGTFLARGADDGLLPLASRETVSEGEILGYLRNGPIRAVITAPASGSLTGVRPEEGMLLGYGDTVFTMEITS